MCRKNLAAASALIGFGAGLLLGVLIESSLLQVVLGAAAVGVGFGLLRTKC